MAYLDANPEGHPVIFLHGTGCDSEDWHGVVAQSPPVVRPVRPEFRGHGRSDIPPEGFTIEDLVLDVIALLDHLDLARVLLAGHSLGGMAAMGVAARSPRVAGCVLLEGWTSLVAARAFPKGRYHGGLSEQIVRQITDKSRRTTERFSGAAWSRFWESVEAFDGSDFLRETQIPVVAVFGGMGSDGVGRERLLLPDRPNISLRWAPGCGHYLPQEAPDLVAEICAEAVRRLAEDR
jgi:pimeloyl-ACP methyl ester carboxylesterase